MMSCGVLTAAIPELESVVVRLVLELPSCRDRASQVTYLIQEYKQHLQ